MELIIPRNDMDFDFHSARTSPHVSPPMTPRRFGESYFSAPTSPSRVAEFYREFDEISKMGVHEDSMEFDFQFCSDMQISDTLCSADDLFDGGKIRPMMKSLPKLEIVSRDFMANEIHQSSLEKNKISNISHSSRRAIRSFSRLRGTEIVAEHGDQHANDIAKPASSSSSSSVFRKWKLKDFLLFRSASEGRASNKYPLKKFAALKKDQEYGKSMSFRSTDSLVSEAGMRKKSQISAHEVHYTKNKAAAESLKKKTYLPYKQGIFGRLF